MGLIWAWKYLDYIYITYHAIIYMKYFCGVIIITVKTGNGANGNSNSAMEAASSQRFGIQFPSQALFLLSTRQHFSSSFFSVFFCRIVDYHYFIYGCRQRLDLMAGPRIALWFLGILLVNLCGNACEFFIFVSNSYFFG